MSFRLRLNLLITFLFLLALLGGSSYIINTTHQAVENEMQSTTQLTSQLVELLWVSLHATDELVLQEQFVQGLNRLSDNRHLQIYIIKQDEPVSASVNKSLNVVTDVPSWFVSLVRPPPVEYRRVFSAQGIPNIEVHIRANPSDELVEAWNESKNVLLLLFLFVITTNIFIYLILGRDLAPIETILKGLNQIEKGDYQLRLPKFTLPELDRISEKFNHMASVLQRSQEDNRYLTQHSLAIQEDARRNLAQELHDELGQSLSAVKAVAVSIQRGNEQKDSTVADNAGMIISFVDRMYEVAHSMMQRLRPLILDEFGLVTALQELVDGWNTRHSDAFCHFIAAGELSNLSDSANINIYRIIQESLTNISKYAQASEVFVTMKREETDMSNALILSIKDDGIGFDTMDKSKGLGILGIRERVQALNGEFELYTEQGKGVDIKITVPVKLNTGKGRETID